MIKNFILTSMCLCVCLFSSEEIPEKIIIINTEWFDLHEHTKANVMYVFSQYESLDGDENFLYNYGLSIDDESLHKLNLEEKQNAIQRLYTTIAASIILKDRNADISIGEIENLRHELNERYEIEIQTYPALIKRNDERVNIAYALLLVNMLSIVDIDDIIESNKEILNFIGFHFVHDKRMLRSLIHMIQFFAFSELENIFYGEEHKLDLLKSLSDKLSKGRCSNLDVANRINKLFLPQENL